MKRRDGFTLIELLTVLGVIGLLATILIPSFATVLGLARRGACKSNLKQLVMGVVAYKDDNDDILPPHSMEAGPTPTRWWGYDAVGRASDTDGIEPEGDIWGYLNKEEVYRCPMMASRGWEFNSARVGYGYNAWFLGYGVNTDPPTDEGTGVTPDVWCNFSYIRNASQLIVFADSAYRGSGDRGASYAMWYPEADAHVDMRHDDTGCVAFFDGSARTFRSEEINPTAAEPRLRYWDPRWDPRQEQ